MDAAAKSEVNAPDWIALREPLDHGARSEDLARAFAAVAPRRVIDLACGSGSNVRYLRPFLGAVPWCCIDNDPDLMERARAELVDVDVVFEERDLARDLAAVSIEPAAAVTTSAFLDVTSAAWLEGLARACEGVPVLAAMTADGRFSWTPEEPEDDAVRDLLRARQRRDRGFGPALGGEATSYLADAMRRLGHRVTVVQTDWNLGPGDASMLGMWVEGAVRAAGEERPDVAIDRWAAARRGQVESGRLRMVVGHQDLLAVP